jgi:hypothetical protein
MKDICIIVPYRDREEHLKKFVPHITKVLKSENLTFDILIVEQTHEKPFNRAKLLNVGYAFSKTPTYGECVSLSGEEKYSNYIFHDVDMLPIEGKASYAVVKTPTHYAAIVEQFGWNLAYQNYVGGVTAFDPDSFEKINGFCNEYYGWGAEDDDLFRRCQAENISFNRRNNMYASLSHERVILQDLYNKNLSLLGEWEAHRGDGLLTLEYAILTIDDVPEGIPDIVVTGGSTGTSEWKYVKVKVNI